MNVPIGEYNSIIYFLITMSIVYICISEKKNVQHRTKLNLKIQYIPCILITRKLYFRL